MPITKLVAAVDDRRFFLFSSLKNKSLKLISTAQEKNACSIDALINLERKMVEQEITEETESEGFTGIA